MINKSRLNEVSSLLDAAMRGGRIAQGKVKDEINLMFDTEESHSTSDFPAAFQSVTNRALMQQYDAIASVWQQYARQYDVNRLKPESFYSFIPDYSNLPGNNAGQRLVEGGLPRVPELTEFPTFSFTASETSINVAKFGARVSFSFEMLLNDEWGVLETLPMELAVLARNQEDIVATEVLASATGPNPVTFSVANGNIITGNPALDVDALDAAVNSIRQRTFNGRPVTVQRFTLMVPPSLEREARRILSIPAFEVTDANGTYTIPNPVSDIDLVVNPWLPFVDVSANNDTTWYVLPSGSAGVRPAVVVSRLRGRQNPELRIRTAGGQYLGGGEVSGVEGDFETDDIQFRVRHYVGAAGIAAETMAVSNGSGV